MIRKIQWQNCYARLVFSLKKIVREGITLNYNHRYQNSKNYPGQLLACVPRSQRLKRNEGDYEINDTQNGSKYLAHSLVSLDTLMYDLCMSSESILIISLIRTELTRHQWFVLLVN